MYAVLHPSNFFAQAAVHQRPELRKKPFVVLDGEPPSETVFAANNSARSLGVEIGMTRLHVEAFSEVIALRRVIEHEHTAHASLHHVACMFSPRIELVEERPGTYALDVSGMDLLYGDAGQLANKLRQSVMTAGFLANVAVAENFHAAVSLASSRTGVSVVPPGGEAHAIGQLPLTALHLTPEHEATFATWGIRTCADLAALAETELISRLGQVGKKLHSLACGTWPHLMFPMEASFEAGLVERMELDFPVEELERLLFLISRMTTTLLERVRGKARAIAALRVILRLDGGAQHERTVRPALPLQDTPTLLKLIQLDLETHPPCAAILGLELHAQSAVPYRAQHGLFLPQSPEPGQLEVMLARMRKLLGEKRVGSPELTDDHRPNAFRMVPFAPPQPRRNERPSLSTPIALRVSRPPQMVGVALTNQVPVRVFWDGASYVVRDAAGPVRVSGQWWSEANWCREEWDVRLENASAERLCRIAFDPRSRCWYVQGTYD
ncbi:DNA polymerase Y family protein [Tunturibacter empetritectus]|uniref:Protein ImuB n=1 Tax=Tunturiibacter empetritectus TaxID=3069691 RepID=A0A7W8II00_9BACT|nr:DNA polymerase Y family protein [Edaphobacter lichenicola]MBB5316656.1 protein ImuB [Edaphobacter lichenicola]